MLDLSPRKVVDQFWTTTTMAKDRQDVEFSTADGLKLRGLLFPAGERRPTIIMSPGVSS